jgi:ABC-type cobalamin transport system permease subunit
MAEAIAGPHRGLLVDWRAVFWAALIAGTLFLALNLLVVPPLMDSSFWIGVRLVASIALGTDVLAPPATFHGGALAACIATHYLLAFLMTASIAIVVHLGGLFVGIVGGAILGLCFYFIDYYTFSYFFPQFFALKHWSVIASHVVFGAVAGGLYEALERDDYERAQGEIGGN